MAFVENLDAFLADFGVVAVYGSETASVIFDMPDLIIAGDQISADYLITYKATVFTALKYGDAITVDGTAYTVSFTQVVGDGKFKTASLNKV